MPRLLLICAILCMMAGPLSAGNGGEALWAGVNAYRAGDYDAAIAHLASENDNPYIEMFRLLYRAECLMRDSLYQGAAAEIDTLFALVNAGAVDKSHRAVARARDLYIEALASRGQCIPGMSADLPPSIPSGIGEPSSRAWFMASRACLAEGDSARAMEYFVKGSIANPTGADASLFRELFYGCEPRLRECSDRALLGIVSRATDIDLPHEAYAVVDYLLVRKPNDANALLCRANVMFKSGEPERALGAYWSVFYSTAPVSAKASALFRISSIEYHLKRYDKAAKYYRMYGTFYPHEDAAPLALDTAARIYVMRKEWNKALATWAILREKHRDGNRIEAGLSEAVLRYWLGDNTEAHEILKGILPRTRGAQNAAALFWLMKTSSVDAERAEWSARLLLAWPRSFYASLVGGETSALTMRPRDSEAREMDALARYAENRRTMCDAIEADSAFARHPAFRAYIAFLDRGLYEEAQATVYAMFRIPGLLYRTRNRGESNAEKRAAADEVIPDRLFTVYGEAARRGFGAISLSLLSRTSPTDSSGIFPAELWYPVSYADEILSGAALAGISPFLVIAIVREESRFDPNALSRAGAVGLMQLLPTTASWHSSLSDTVTLEEKDLRDPAKNIRAGIMYLRYLLGRFDGSVIGALASYNGGEGRMARWKENFDPGSNPLVALELIGPRETRLYVKKVLDTHSAYAAMAREKAGTE